MLRPVVPFLLNPCSLHQSRLCARNMVSDAIPVDMRGVASSEIHGAGGRHFCVSFANARLCQTVLLTFTLYHSSPVCATLQGLKMLREAFVCPTKDNIVHTRLLLCHMQIGALMPSAERYSLFPSALIQRCVSYAPGVYVRQRG
jgi:hypothetical protein